MTWERYGGGRGRWVFLLNLATLYCHYVSMMTSPGYLKTDPKKCCHICKRTVFMHNHHCIFTSGCIGYRNTKAFALFCFYLFFTCLSNCYFLVTGFHENDYEDGLQSVSEIFVNKFCFWRLIYFKYPVKILDELLFMASLLFLIVSFKMFS